MTSKSDLRIAVTICDTCNECPLIVSWVSGKARFLCANCLAIENATLKKKIAQHQKTLKALHELAEEDIDLQSKEHLVEEN